jgi:hypothetical protein
MIIVKLAGWTCVFYMAIAALAQLALYAAARLKGGLMYYATPRGWMLFFAIVWVASFGLAWHVFSAEIHAKFAR